MSPSAVRAHALRLPPGADLRGELERLGFRAAAILTCVGSLARANLRMPGAQGEPEQVRVFEGPMEILSLSGTLTPDGLHVHIALSRRDGACVGGHLLAGSIVHTTAELVIAELPDLAFDRPLDPATGYHELSISSRDPP